MILADLEGDVPRAAAALRSELGADIPHKTLQRWRDEAHRSSAQPSVGTLSDRALRLLAGEMTRLERLPSSKLDLERLSKVATTLKTLDGLRESRRAVPKRRTLADLNGSDPREPEGVLSGQPSPLSLAGLDALASDPASDPPG